MAALHSEGTLTTTASTEVQVGTDITAPGNYITQLDLSGITGVQTATIRVYSLAKTTAGGEKTVYSTTLTGNQLEDPIVVTPPYCSVTDLYKVTVEASASSIAIDWAIAQLDG